MAMPVTLVFKRLGPGTLQQVQVGAADIVATLAAAHTAFGWLGGLVGVQRFFETLKTVMRRDPFGSLKINKIVIPSSKCHILTSRGMFYFQDEDGQRAFAGDPLMQTIGLTICALEYECGGEVAVGLFVRCIASLLMEGPASNSQFPDLSQALYQELIDHLPAIINEGAARNLQRIFSSAADHLPAAPERWQFPTSLEDESSQQPEHYELSLLGGLLLWLSESGSDPYYTRSALAARNAAYLKAIGYPIGPVCVWDGQGELPVPKPCGVVLVIGGSSDTDSKSAPFKRVPVVDAEVSLKYHYREETIGSMLVNALGVKLDLLPESVQEMFNYVETCMSQTLYFDWETRPRELQRRQHPSEVLDWDGATLFCVCRMKDYPKKAKPLATSLASIYFGTTADFVALCYERIASESCVTTVKEERLSDLNLVRSADLAWFWIVTASIIYCIAKALVKDFKSLFHVVKMRLCSQNWLEAMTRRLNHTLRSGVPFYEAAIIVGIIHAGASTELLELQTVERPSILGVRNGRYAVVPSVLSSMSPTSDGVGIACFDKFIANVPVFSDSSIRGDDKNAGLGWSPPDRRAPDTSWQVLSEPTDAPADISLYIGIERAHHSSVPSTVLCARIGGTVASTINIRRVMWHIVKSLEVSKVCNGHSAQQRAIILKPSVWGILGQERWERFGSELTKRHHFFLPALGDAAWALYIAGSALPCRVAISHGCFECAASAIESPSQPSVICGYGGIVKPYKALPALPDR